MTRLLIVDDNPQSLYLLQVLLSTNGFELELASNGAEALERARRAPPDMIISDILMPVMDGFALCRACKQDERLKDIPFIFYTATYTDPKDEEFALSLGAERFIVKPLEPDKFLARLRETIETHAAGKRVAPREPMAEEAEYYKQYNAALIRKLENKVLQLKEANRALELDIAERKRAEARFTHLNEVLRAVRNVNQLITRERDSQQLMSDACAILVHTRGYCMAWIGLIEPGHPRVMPAARAGQGTDYLDQVTITWDESETGQGPTGTALRTRRPALCANTATDPRFALWREAALQHGFASFAAAPVLHGERLFGVVNVYADKPGAFDDEEISLLAELAGDLGFALQSIEHEAERKRAEREVESLARFATENPNPIMRVEQDGRIIYANAASQPLLRLWNCAVGEYLPPAWRDRVTEAATSQSRITVDVECGEQVYSILTAPVQAAGYVNLYGRDITERKRQEAQLAVQLDELRRWHAAILGRETRVLDLKREVNELLAQIGKPPRYPSAEAENP